jgi:branched-chain amino acid transport system ATP-binding protein
VTEDTRRPLTLEARNLRVRFGGVVALSDVTFAVPSDSIVGLVGPNGAGKSTAFAVLSGLRRADAGQVFLNGAEVTGASAQVRARKGLARTFQQPELFHGFSVREHIVLGDRMRHAPKRMLRDTFLAGGFRRADPGEKDRVEAILDLLRITSVAGREVAGLPLGISRLVEIARAVATCPSVLLLDEPMSGLSSAETAALADALRQLVATQELSILLVEHDVPMVLDLCSTVVVLDYGQVIANGAAADVRRDAAVQAAYFGDLSMGTPGSSAP